MDFPSQRFADAGATEQELRELEASFDALPEAVQAQRAEYYEGLATYDLTGLVAALREREGVDGTLEGPEVDAGQEEGEQGAAAGPGDVVLGVLSPPAAGQEQSPAVENPPAPGFQGPPPAPAQ